MSAQLGETGPALHPPRPVGLWSSRWFRVLTIVNVTILVVSTYVAVLGFAAEVGLSTEGWLAADAWYELWYLFPAVHLTRTMPGLSLFIVAVAAALSCLAMIGRTQKGVRWLRAMTVWGTVALALPVLGPILWLGIALGAGSLLNLTGGSL